MSEHPPKKLSRGKQREVARAYALKENLHTQTKEAIAQAKEARKRAKYVERGVLERAVDAVVDITVGTPPNKKYMKTVYEKALVDPTQNVPETGPERRKAAREYSRTHNISGQIKEEQRRLEELSIQTKRLQTGPITRTVLGKRSRKYEEALFQGKNTKEEIESQLAQTAEEKLKFRAPKPKKIIDITPPVTQEEAPRGRRPYVEPRQSSSWETEPVEEEKQTPEQEEVIVEEVPDLSAEAHIDRVNKKMASEEEVGINYERNARAAVGRMVRAEQRGFAVDVARTGKIGKNVFWTRIWSFIKGASIPFALLLAAAGAKTAVDNYNSRPTVSRSVSGEDVDYQSIAQAQISPEEVGDTVSFEEVRLPVESELVADEEQALTPEEREELLAQNPEGYEPSGVEEARLRAQAAAQGPVRGLEPPSAPEE